MIGYILSSPICFNGTDRYSFTFDLFLFCNLFCCVAVIRSAREAGTLQFVAVFFLGNLIKISVF